MLKQQSKIILGTVQFGISYGISNNLGKTSKKNSLDILEYAYSNGIKYLDTAPSYGDSESVIGELNDKNYWRIISKTPSFSGNFITEESVEKLVNYFNLSRIKLSQNVIYGLLIHSCDDLFKPGGDKLFKAMEKLKQDGYVKKIGVSVYNVRQIDSILEKYSVDLVQLPINILDQRFIVDGRLVKLKRYGVEVHARSALLQGLLMMPINNISSWFDPIKGVLEKFHMEAEKLGVSDLQLALSFVQSIHEVDNIVLGVNTLEQLHEVLSMPLINNINIDDFSFLSVNDDRFINPSNWII